MINSKSPIKSAREILQLCDKKFNIWTPHSAGWGAAIIGDVRMRSSLNFNLLLLLVHDVAEAAHVLYCDGVYQLPNRFPNFF